MKKILTIVFFNLTVQLAFAYPITPQTLRKLITNSRYIVIASIDNPEKIEKYYDKKLKDSMEILYLGGDGLADLNIIEVLKGNPEDRKHLQVAYEAGMICPAPPHYPDKKTVIAFLDKNDTSKVYYTEGLSYGSKIMDSESELSSFKLRINEYLGILEIKNDSERKKATVEWLVKCAENKLTRWEGAYELSRKGDFMSFYDRSEDEKFYEELTASQLKRLDSAFFATDTIDYSELCLVNLITKGNHAKLKQHLLKNLSFADYYIANDIMQMVADIDPNEELKKLYEEASALYHDSKNDTKHKKIISKFISVANNESK